MNLPFPSPEAGGSLQAPVRHDLPVFLQSVPVRRAGVWLLVTLWGVLLLNAWCNLHPVGVLLWATLAGMAILNDARLSALLLLFGLSMPLAFPVWRPFVISCLWISLLAFSNGQLRLSVPRGSGKAALLVIAYLGYQAILSLGAEMSFALPYLSQIVEGAVLFLLLLTLLRDSGSVLMTLQGVTLLAGAALILSTMCCLLGSQTWLAEQSYTEDTEIKSYLMNGSIQLARRFTWDGVDPNYWGSFLQFPLWVAVGLWIGERRASLRFVWIITALCILTGIVGTYSRGSFLSVVAIFLVFAARHPQRLTFYGVGLIVIGGVVIAAIPTLSDRIMNISSDIDDSGGAGRLALWQQGLDMWLQSPWIGHGLGAFVAKQRAGVHNTYIEILAETGVVGLTLYLSILFAGLAAWYRVLRFCRAAPTLGLYWVAEGGFLGLLGTAINNFFITSHDPKYLWPMVALAMTLYATTRCRHASQSLSPQTP